MSTPPSIRRGYLTGTHSVGIVEEVPTITCAGCVWCAGTPGRSTRQTTRETLWRSSEIQCVQLPSLGGSGRSVSSAPGGAGGHRHPAQSHHPRTGARVSGVGLSSGPAEKSHRVPELRQVTVPLPGLPGEWHSRVVHCAGQGHLLRGGPELDRLPDRGG